VLRSHFPSCGSDMVAIIENEFYFVFCVPVNFERFCSFSISHTLHLTIMAQVFDKVFLNILTLCDSTVQRAPFACTHLCLRTVQAGQAPSTKEKSYPVCRFPTPLVSFVPFVVKVPPEMESHRSNPCKGCRSFLIGIESFPCRDRVVSLQGLSHFLAGIQVIPYRNRVTSLQESK